MTNEQTTDLVWIRGTAEVDIGGVDAIVVYESISRSEWDSMTTDQREAYIDEVGASALEQIASYGASVVDEDEVPDEHKQ